VTEQIAWHAKTCSVAGNKLTEPRLQHLIRQHSQDIAKSIVLEQGKTFADAQGDVGRGLQVG
jgi:malonate-semialdehyde dehydrogenase (acetylating)/methylmalonate-semialdehyde dehydrogenase